MYHVTPPESAQSITATGLRAPAYLWADDSFAIEFAQDYLPNGYAMFEVDVTGPKLVPDTDFQPFGEIEAWISEQAIPAAKVRLVGGREARANALSHYGGGR